LNMAKNTVDGIPLQEPSTERLSGSKRPAIAPLCRTICGNAAEVGLPGAERPGKIGVRAGRLLLSVCRTPDARRREAANGGSLPVDFNSGRDPAAGNRTLDAPPAVMVLGEP